MKMNNNPFVNSVNPIWILICIIGIYLAIDIAITKTNAWDDILSNPLAFILLIGMHFAILFVIGFAIVERKKYKNLNPNPLLYTIWTNDKICFIYKNHNVEYNYDNIQNLKIFFDTMRVHNPRTGYSAKMVHQIDFYFILDNEAHIQLSQSPNPFFDADMSQCVNKIIPYLGKFKNYEHEFRGPIIEKFEEAILKKHIIN